MTRKKLPIDSNYLIDLFVAPECDINDVYAKNDKLVIEYDNGGLHTRTITKKELEKRLEVSNLVFKDNKYISYERD